MGARLEGWSLCLAEIGFQLYGIPSRGLLDIKFLRPEQAEAETRAATRPGATLRALVGTANASERG